MRRAIQKTDSDSSPGPSFDGSFRKVGAAASLRSTSQGISGKFVPTSRSVYKLLKEYSAKLVDFDLFSEYIVDWVSNKLHSRNDEGELQFNPPFLIDDLRTFDFAVEGVPFQQLLRMPYPSHASSNLKEDEFLALEDFLHTAAEGLWRALWHKKKPLPFYVSCPLYPDSKFYTVEKSISRGRLEGLRGVALMSRNSDRTHAGWGDVVKFALFRQCLTEREGSGLSPSAVCEAVFYAIHILISRNLSKQNTVSTDCVFVSIIDSKFGGLVKLGGDLHKLEVDISNPYQSMAEWITLHAEISVSHVDQIWNKLGNVNWGDFGTLQVLLAMYYSMVQWNGPPRKSMASLAANHNLRLQNRRLGTQTVEIQNALVPYQHGGEIMEASQENNHKSKMELRPGEIILLEDQYQSLKGFQIQDILNEASSSYIAVATNHHTQLLTLYVGAHPSRLEPSWEDMNLWYLVQRQTKVLSILTEKGISSKHLPELVASGRIMHSGPCEKESPKGRCGHPWCGTPILVTSPIGDPISAIVAQHGPFSPDETTRCCRDCLAALRSAKTANVLHGDIRPENVMRIGTKLFVLVSWGHAVLEDRDSPPLNLQFSSAHTLQHGKLCPSSDVESLVYLMYFVCGGVLPPQDSIESALNWRQKSWVSRVIQQRLGEVSPILKAFADYVDSICGTQYAVNYDVWVKRLDGAVDGRTERGKDAAETEGNAGGRSSL